MLYRAFVPLQAVGSNKVYFDLFNGADSDSCLEIVSMIPVVSGSVAVTGTLAVDLYLTRTTAVGTGGTLATSEGTSLTAMTISAAGTAPPIHRAITGRLAPSGGATAGAVLAMRSVFTEETNAGTYLAPLHDFVRGSIHVIKGSGLRVIQGSVASVGNIGFDIAFKVCG